MIALRVGSVVEPAPGDVLIPRHGDVCISSKTIKHSRVKPGHTADAPFFRATMMRVVLHACAPSFALIVPNLKRAIPKTDLDSLQALSQSDVVRVTIVMA